ncbi:MAG: hypothetical protein JO007_07485 [Alphaproteobacteria bacterium]|nr:hypothetical protein [Alphaproteobacteria bacterium]
MPSSCYCRSWRGLHRRANAGFVWISDPGDYATFNSNHTPDGTDDYAGALANFKKNGAQILEERVNNGRHVCWVSAPDGAQMELIEKV